MWLSLIITLLTYLMSPRDTAKERRSALLKAGAAGAITYGVTEYTDWGQENLAPLDSSIGEVFTPTPDPAEAGESSSVNTGGLQSLWDKLGAWGPAAVGAAGGLAVSGGLTSLLPWALGALAVFIILK